MDIEEANGQPTRRLRLQADGLTPFQRDERLLVGGGNRNHHHPRGRTRVFSQPDLGFVNENGDDTIGGGWQKKVGKQSVASSSRDISHLPFMPNEAGICMITGLSRLTHPSAKYSHVMTTERDGEIGDTRNLSLKGRQLGSGNATGAMRSPRKAGAQGHYIDNLEPSSGSNEGNEMVVIHGLFPSVRDPSLVWVRFGGEEITPLECTPSELRFLTPPVRGDFVRVPVSVTFDGGESFSSAREYFEYYDPGSNAAIEPGSHVYHWGPARAISESKRSNVTNGGDNYWMERKYPSMEERKLRVFRDLMRTQLKYAPSPEAEQELLRGCQGDVIRAIEKVAKKHMERLRKEAEEKEESMVRGINVQSKDASYKFATSGRQVDEELQAKIAELSMATKAARESIKGSALVGLPIRQVACSSNANLVLLEDGTVIQSGSVARASERSSGTLSKMLTLTMTMTNTKTSTLMSDEETDQSEIVHRIPLGGKISQHPVWGISEQTDEEVNESAWFWEEQTKRMNILGDPSPREYVFPRWQPIQKIACGDAHFCAVSDRVNGHRLFTWGRNDYGQLGLGLDPRTIVTEPTKVKFPHKAMVTTITCGKNSTLACALSKEGLCDIYSWGEGNREHVSEIGYLPYEENSNEPKLVVQVVPRFKALPVSNPREYPKPFWTETLDDWVSSIHDQWTQNKPNATFQGFYNQTNSTQEKIQVLRKLEHELETILAMTEGFVDDIEAAFELDADSTEPLDQATIHVVHHELEAMISKADLIERNLNNDYSRVCHILTDLEKERRIVEIEIASIARESKDTKLMLERSKQLVFSSAFPEESVDVSASQGSRGLHGDQSGADSTIRSTASTLFGRFSNSATAEPPTLPGDQAVNGLRPSLPKKRSSRSTTLSNMFLPKSLSNRQNNPKSEDFQSKMMSGSFRSQSTGIASVLESTMSSNPGLAFNADLTNETRVFDQWKDHEQDRPRMQNLLATSKMSSHGKPPDSPNQMPRARSQTNSSTVSTTSKTNESIRNALEKEDLASNRTRRSLKWRKAFRMPFAPRGNERTPRDNGHGEAGNDSFSQGQNLVRNTTTGSGTTAISNDIFSVDDGWNQFDDLSEPQQKIVQDLETRFRDRCERLKSIKQKQAETNALSDHLMFELERVSEHAQVLKEFRVDWESQQKKIPIESRLQSRALIEELGIIEDMWLDVQECSLDELASDVKEFESKRRAVFSTQLQEEHDQYSNTRDQRQHTLIQAIVHERSQETQQDDLAKICGVGDLVETCNARLDRIMQGMNHFRDRYSDSGFERHQDKVSFKLMDLAQDICSLKQTRFACLEKISTERQRHLSVEQTAKFQARRLDKAMNTPSLSSFVEAQSKIPYPPPQLLFREIQYP